MTATLHLPRAIPDADCYVLRDGRDGIPELVGTLLPSGRRVRLTEPQDGRRFDRKAFLEALELLGITCPVRVRMTQGVRTAGAWRFRDGTHCITLSSRFTAERLSRTLWHELAHAAQCEEAGGDVAFRKLYSATRRAVGYARHPLEVNAREAEANHHTHPLVTIGGNA